MTRFEKIMTVLLVVDLVLLVLVILLAPSRAPAQPDQVLHLNGQAIDLHGAQSVQVQSADSLSVFAADEKSGAVTVTTSIVTVTIWMAR